MMNFNKFVEQNGGEKDAMKKLKDFQYLEEKK